MATAAEILALRRYINQETNTEPWTDETLGAMVDASGSSRLAASQWWEGEAAKVAHLVDISEGGSSRKMSEVHTNYLAQAARYAGPAGGEIQTAASRTRLATRY